MPNNRGQSRHAYGLPIDDITDMYGLAQMLHGYEGEFGPLKLQAFLTLATLMEGVLTQLALLFLQRDDDYAALRGRRSGRYGIDNAISDLYLLKKINTDDFKNLQRFKDDRNRCMHELFRQGSGAGVQKYAGELFLKHQAIFDAILEKLSLEIV